jgi:hypothetical protein
MNDLISGLRAYAELIRDEGISAQGPRRHRVAALLYEAAGALEAACEDAERYRTLVASGKFVPATLSPSCLWGLRTGGIGATKAELDEAIDRARHAEGDGE